ncbi:hypothetical protein STAS_26783 [Striga asiatica]|uniref:Uncharacterized protein n=1 Tax=Striga asiatica TaxID=4170 RepID=A0A5A7QX44_STRAF|nr:hypothetical protein STAS_26783 [Striga asiatica]
MIIPHINNPDEKGRKKGHPSGHQEKTPTKAPSFVQDSLFNLKDREPPSIEKNPVLFPILEGLTEKSIGTDRTTNKDLQGSDQREEQQVVSGEKLDVALVFAHMELECLTKNVIEERKVEAKWAIFAYSNTDFLERQAQWEF